MIEQPKNDYKLYSKQVEVSSDEFAHVVEIYNFPSDFKTSDLAAVFSPFKTGGFELKWVDDTHCLGVFSSPLIGKIKSNKLKKKIKSVLRELIRKNNTIEIIFFLTKLPRYWLRNIRLLKPDL